MKQSSYSIKDFQLVVMDRPLIPAKIQPFVGMRFSSSTVVYRTFRNLYQIPVETFISLHLNGKNEFVGMTTHSIGTMTSSLVHPRDVFRPAVLNMTAGLIFVHNHPSGDPEPSKEDMSLTRRLAQAGELLGIRVLDHVIIGAKTYYSLADNGVL